MRVWLENWEWQCCGDKFAVGDEVEWGLLPARDRSYLARPLGQALADSITHFETHHEGVHEEQPMPTPGRIESILAAYWQLAPRPSEDPRVVYPVAGTAVLEARDSADGWEPEKGDGVRFEGYIVAVSPVT